MSAPLKEPMVNLRWAFSSPRLNLSASRKNGQSGKQFYINKLLL